VLDGLRLQDQGAVLDLEFHVVRPANGRDDQVVEAVQVGLAGNEVEEVDDASHLPADLDQPANLLVDARRAGAGNGLEGHALGVQAAHDEQVREA